MTTPPLDSLAKILDVVNTRSGRALPAAIALAGVILLIILYTPGQVAETHLEPIRRDLASWGGHILIYTLVFGAYFLVLLVRHCWNRRKNILLARRLKRKHLLIWMHFQMMRDVFCASVFYEVTAHSEPTHSAATV